MDRTPHPALVTGKVLYLYGYALPWSNHCPSSMGALHWDRYGHNQLHKDDHTQHYHAQARALAVRQTQHEWCRLLALAYGDDDVDAVRRLFAAWVAVPDAAAAACATADFPVPLQRIIPALQPQPDGGSMPQAKAETP